MKKLLFALFFIAICVGAMGQINPPANTIVNKPVVNKNLQLSDSITGAPVRFAVSLNGNFQARKNFSFSARYNTNGFAASISPEGITIRKSGLYHFEGFVYAEAFDDADTANGFSSPQFTAHLIVGETPYTVAFRDIMPGIRVYNRGRLDSRNFKYSKSFSMDIYIVAPATIRFSRDFTSTITNESQYYSNGWLTGYYKSE